MQIRSPQPDAIAITESEAYQTLLARAQPTDGRRAGRAASCATSCRSRRAATGRSSATRSTRCSAAARPRTRTRFRSSDGHGAGCWVCTRPGAAGRAHARTARCSVGSSRSTAVVSAPISSGTRSGCASTSSPSSRTWSRSGVASISSARRLRRRHRCGGIPIRPLTGLGDWLARVRWVDGVPDRGLRRWLRPTNGTWLDRRDSRSAAAATDARGSVARRAQRRQQRAGTARTAAARARAARAPDADREHPEAACTARCTPSSNRSIPISATALTGSSRGDACSWPTTWVSARPRRRLPPATRSGIPAASAVACSSSPPRSSRSGFVSGRPSPTLPPPSSRGRPPSAAPRSRRVGADSSWATTSSSFATSTSFANGRRTSWCSTRPSGSRTGRRRPR